MASSSSGSGDTIITYKIEFTKHFPGTVKQVQAGDAIEYAAKDFLTFIFCGLNDEYLKKVKSQLKNKGRMLDMNGTTVSCWVTTPIDQQTEFDVKKVIHDIQASVLSIQDQLNFEELPWPEAEEVVSSLQKSSAKEDNLLQFHLYRNKDQSQVMLLVYAKSCKEEINNYTGTKYITHRISMKPFRAQALLNFGLLQATEKRFGRNFVMNADTSDLSVMVKADCNANIDAVLLFISQFDNSVIHRPVSCPLHQLNVLELPKVKNGLRNAVVSYNVFLEIDTLKSFHLFSQSEESLTKSAKIIEDTLVERKIPIKNAIKDVLRTEDWKEFTDSVFRNGDNNEFIISESEKNLEITGLRNQVNDVVGFINDLIDEETERINVEVQNDTSADLPIDNIERFSYLKQFYKPPEKVHLGHYSSQARQGFHLTGPAIEVQKAKEHLHHFLNTISVKTLKFNDNGYLNTDDGLQFLQDKIIRDCTVVFAFPENKHSLSNQGTARSENACSIDGTDDSDKKINRWEIGRKCKVVLMAEDDVEAEVNIQIVEHKTKGKYTYLPYGPAQKSLLCQIRYLYIS